MPSRSSSTPKSCSASRASRSHTAQFVTMMRISSCKDSLDDMRRVTLAHQSCGSSDVEIADFECVLFDKLAPWLDHVAHQRAENFLGFLARRNLHPQHRARLRIHRGLPQLPRIHLAQALVTLDLDALLPGSQHGLRDRLERFDGGFTFANLQLERCLDRIEFRTELANLAEFSAMQQRQVHHRRRGRAILRMAEDRAPMCFAVGFELVYEVVVLRV